ncbi:MAG TPA: MFS transporter [Desulfobulbaceae bacterium]|nr:MFS transporter [Desulfobulbaceae bacterium]
MDDISEYECPMPETFQEKFGITLFLAWLFYLGFVSRILFAPLMPAIEKDLGIGHGQAGGLFLLISVGYMLAPACSGLISSRFEHSGTLKFSAWLVGFALLAFSLIDNILGMGMLLLLIGFAGSLHLPSAIATITAEIQKSDWGKGLSVHQCAPPLSFVTAPLIAALLLRWYSWRQILMVWAILCLVSALLYTLRGRGGEFPGRVVNIANVKPVFASRSFWIMVVLLSMAFSGNSGIFAMLPLFLVHERGYELASANTLIGLSQISCIAVVFAAGWLSDRIGQKRVMGGSLLATGILTLLLPWTAGGMLILVLFLQAATLTAFFPAGFAALSRVTLPSLRSVTSALGPPLAFLVGGGIMPTMIGYLADLHSFVAGIRVAGSFILLGCLLVVFLRLGQYDDQTGC